MAPRDFSETGAMGAGTGAGNSMTPQAPAPSPAAPPPPPQVSAPQGQSSGWQSPIVPGTNTITPDHNPIRPPLSLYQDTSGITPWGQQFRQQGGWSQGFTSRWAEGGAIPMEGEDPNNMPMGPANGLAAMMAKAVGSAKEILAYGRKKHGLGGGEDEGAIPGAQAGMTRMPTVPGTQSESGIKPLQPAPGRLPPTSNPFGKRAEAEPEDTGGAIDTDEEEMA